MQQNRPKADMTFIPERGSRFNSIKAASYLARILKGEKPNNLPGSRLQGD
jgi:hypothetical protein